MRRSSESKFSLGAVLLAIGLALCASAIFIGWGGSFPNTAGVAQPVSTVAQLGDVFEFLVMLTLVVVAIGLCVCCAYLHLAARFREQSMRGSQSEWHDKT